MLYISGSGIGWLVGGSFIGEAFLAFDHSRNTITYHNALCLSPQNLHKHCLQILLGVKMAPRETENNAYTKFWGDKQRVLWYVMVFLEWSIIVTA